MKCKISWNRIVNGIEIFVLNSFDIICVCENMATYSKLQYSKNENKAKFNICIVKNEFHD
jgi:hypothetical protein